MTRICCQSLRFFFFAFHMRRMNSLILFTFHVCSTLVLQSNHLCLEQERYSTFFLVTYNNLNRQFRLSLHFFLYFSSDCSIWISLQKFCVVLLFVYIHWFRNESRASNLYFLVLNIRSSEFNWRASTITVSVGEVFLRLSLSLSSSQPLCSCPLTR